MPSYRAGHDVHWIQGRKALEAAASEWQRVEIVEVGEQELLITTGSAQIRLFCAHAETIGKPSLPVAGALCLRWHVLAVLPDVASGGITAHATGIGDPEPVRILGSSGLRLFSVAEEPPVGSDQ